MSVLVRLITGVRSHIFSHSLADGDMQQRRELARIMRFLGDTQYARDHGGMPSNYQLFAQQFPVMTYEALYPYIERSLHGEANVLIPGVITDFAKSSGTTNAKSKYIPINRESLERNHYAAGADAVAWAVHKYRLYRAPLGKTLGISGSFGQVPGTAATVRSGDVSAFLNTLVPWWARKLRFPPQEIALIPDWNSKKDWIARNASAGDVRIIVGTPTWVLRILESIRDAGTAVASVWPHLQLFIHGAVAFGPYRESFKTLTHGLDVQLVEAYNATEGFFGFGDDSMDGMYLLTHHGIFYEFIEKGNWHSDNPKAIPLWQVKTGVDYALVVTGYNGLVRYMIGDVIRFTATNPYIIHIVGRTKHFINAFGEEVLGSQLEQSLTHACQKTGARIVSFTVAPRFYENGSGCHEWLIEFEHLPNDMAAFTKIIDDFLASLNSDYEAKRSGSGILGMPTVTIAPAGLFMQYLAAKNKLGAQNKIPVVMNDRNLIDELLTLGRDSAA